MAFDIPNGKSTSTGQSIENMFYFLGVPQANARFLEEKGGEEDLENELIDILAQQVVEGCLMNLCFNKHVVLIEGMGGR
jgi:hypothetical protein